MRKLRAAVILLLIIMMTAGCAKKSFSSEITTIDVKKKSITSAIVEDFEKEYYSESELEAMMNEEIVEYCSSTGSDKSVVLTKFEILDGKAKVFLEYESDEDYKAFNGIEFYCGTITEAYDLGYSLDLTLSDAQSGAAISKADLLEKGSSKIVILKEKVYVQTYGNILYVSNNVEVEDKRLAKVAEDTTELAYIVFK